MMHMVENGKTLPKTLLKHDTSIHFSKPYKISNNSTEVLWTELNWALVFTKHFLFLVECSSAESIVFSRIHSCLQHKVVTNQLIETQQIVAKHSNIWAASYYGNTIITFSSSYSMDIFDEINELPLVQGHGNMLSFCFVIPFQPFIYLFFHYCNNLSGVVTFYYCTSRHNHICTSLKNPTTTR